MPPLLIKKHLEKKNLTVECSCSEGVSMGKGSYSGGGTIIRIGENGTSWGSLDDAGSKKGRSKRGAMKSRQKNRPLTKKQTEIWNLRQEQSERKILRSFISSCVNAYASKKLTAKFPAAPPSLSKRVMAAGGNIHWLEKNKIHQIHFHEMYCRLRKEDIAFVKVWGPPSR